MMEGPPQQPEEEKVENPEQGQQPRPEEEKDPYEGFPTDPEERARLIEMNEWYEANHPTVEVPPEAREDHKEKFAALEEELAGFEGRFDLEELHAITDLTPEDAPNHPVREPAHKALGSIFQNLNYLQKKTDVPPEAYAKLDEQYKRLSRAVGIINNNKVDHTR